MIVLLLVACVTSTSFPTQLVSVSCDRLKECNKATFEDSYDDLADCRDDNEGDAEDVNDCYADNCDFDAKKAQSCLQDYRTSDCDDIGDEDDCSEIYDDCDDADLITCLADVAF
jgi:hypothetical protein